MNTLKKIQELLEDGWKPTKEQPAEQLPNYFDALDGCGATGFDTAATGKDRPGTEGEPKKSL
jgi:hypothetical protein